MSRTLSRSILLPAGALLAFWLARAGAAPTITFVLDPPNPAAGQVVALRDTSPAGATSWLWDFGDGASATQPAPSHAWTAVGAYDVRLTTQGTTAEQSVTVSDASTLRLLGVHPFEISIQVKDPNTGAASAAQAVDVTDRFGWFSFPTLTNDPGNPEITVKVLEAPAFGHYWLFWSAMTSLHYTMTVRDVPTGQVQVYEKNDDSPCGSWDLQSFPYVPTPTPAPPTETPAPGQPSRTRTPTRTPTPMQTGTPAPTAPAPTMTPTPGITHLMLQAYSWQWDWCPGSAPCQAGSCPYEIGPAVPSKPGQNGITLHMGCTYQLTVLNADPPFGDQTQPHQTNSPSNNNIGFPANDILPPGYTDPTVYTLSIPVGAPYDINFSCFNTGCANGSPPENSHERMLGVIHIIP